LYGVTKVAGELLVKWYVFKHGLDVRSLRLPGIISYKTEPGGGTTDYAVAIFYEALKSKRYTCFVKPDTVLPMMYMDDAIHAINLLMQVPADHLTVRTSYNLTALSFTAEELVAEVTKRVPGFVCTYEPDFRQSIADSWPQTIDDNTARQDWGWTPTFTLELMVDEMLTQLKKKFSN
jgi:nucleoside-diphosphate-sugar epimerase